MDANQAESARWNDDAWTRAWPKREVLTDSVTPLLLDALELQPGERVLDVGCGGGKATLAAYERVQPDGSAVGADISEALLALAAERGAGANGISWRRADMQTTRLAGNPFDVAMSQFGVMFFDEPVVAFANIHQHLRNGGRLAFVCWQAIERNPWFVGPTVAPFVAPPPPPGPGKRPTGPFSLGDPARVRAILDDTGFGDVQVDKRSHDVDVPASAVVDDDQLGFMGVPPEAIDDARSAVASAVERFVIGTDLFRFPLAFQIVTARRAG